MARLIKFRAKCAYCGNWFEKGKAYLQRTNGKWLCNCFDCYESRKNVLVTGGIPSGTFTPIINEEDQEAEIRINVMKANTILRGEKW